MTWIVGMPTLWGYSIGISDIRVTLADGSEVDCLQKIYPIAQSIALGFAGSVAIGFTMVRAMQQWLHCDEPDRAWNPPEVVELWPQIAKDIFAAAPACEQAGQCELMMLSADPTPTNPKNSIGPKTHVHIFKSPIFEPIQIETRKAAGIGSGTLIGEFQQYLDGISNKHEDQFNLMKGETGMPGGTGTMLGFSLTSMLKRTNPSGISSHLHYCWVYLGKTIIKTNNHVTTGAWTGFEGGSGINQPDTARRPIDSQNVEGANSFEMPKIVQSWGELHQLLSGMGAKAEGSVT
jgi:hypothetical protein